MTQGQPGKTGGKLVLGLALIVLLLFAGSWLLDRQKNRLQKQYEYEAAITAAPTMAPPTLYARPTELLLRSGSTGLEVRQMQERLQALGYYTGELDGKFGGGTKAAVERFQLQHGLEPDGMAGTATLTMLASAQAQPFVATPKPQLPASQGGLPLLVNRTHALDPGYQPKDLVKLSSLMPKDLMILKNPDVQGSRPAVEALFKMIQAAKADGQEIWQVSEGYRTHQRQQELFEAQVQRYIKEDGMSEEVARKSTEKTVALPGTSEHHTGLAFDLTVPDRHFGDTPQARWLEDHCWDHGFIIRYTKAKEQITGYLPEPWHVRYVGIEEARFMKKHNLALEEYLALF